MNLGGRVAIVTGATSGIGEATAEALAQAGAAVAVVGQNRERGAGVVERLKATGAAAIFLQADVQQSERVRHLVTATLERFGRVDILVNNAGLQHVAPIPEFPEEQWDTLIGVMLTGAFLCTKSCLPPMMRQRWGRIINIASQLGKIATPYKAAYVAAKTGLIGLTRVTALEAASHGITANAICPGYVRTPLVEKQIASQARVHGIDENEVIQKIMLAGAPLKRLLEPSEIASLVLELCSDAAGSITGADISVDGGSTAH